MTITAWCHVPRITAALAAARLFLWEVNLVKAIASLVLLALFSATGSATVNIDIVTVGNPGNAPPTTNVAM